MPPTGLRGLRLCEGRVLLAGAVGGLVDLAVLPPARLGDVWLCLSVLAGCVWMAGGVE